MAKNTPVWPTRRTGTGAKPPGASARASGVQYGALRDQHAKKRAGWEGVDSNYQSLWLRVKSTVDAWIANACEHVKIPCSRVISTKTNWWLPGY
jgi:hypothetical protein